MGGASEGRQRIVDAAERVFQEEGYQTATMSLVAEAAGVSKGLPYHYFHGKATLARAVIQKHLSSIAERLSEWPEGPPTEQLRWFLETALRHAEANQSAYRLYLSLALQPATRDLVLEEVERQGEALTALDRKLQDVFRECGHGEPGTEAIVIRATVDGLIQYLLLQPERFRIEEAVSRLLSLHTQRWGPQG